MPITLVTSVKAASANGSSVTSAGVNTAGANLLVLLKGTTQLGTATVSDSNSNTWTPLTVQTGGIRSARLYYCLSPVVGAGHTFTVSQGAGSNPAVCVLVFSGVGSFDQESGSTTGNQPGSITPSVDGCVLITGAADGAVGTISAVDSGFTLQENQASGALNWQAAIAYLIQTTATAKNPLWTITGTNRPVVMASFKPSVSFIPAPYYYTSPGGYF